jgi:hypothetical protein
MPNINALAKYVIIDNFLSHFAHHRKGYSNFFKGWHNKGVQA